MQQRLWSAHGFVLSVLFGIVRRVRKQQQQQQKSEDSYQTMR